MFYGTEIEPPSLNDKESDDFFSCEDDDDDDDDEGSYSYSSGVHNDSDDEDEDGGHGEGSNLFEKYGYDSDSRYYTPYNAGDIDQQAQSDEFNPFGFVNDSPTGNGDQENGGLNTNTVSSDQFSSGFADFGDFPSSTDDAASSTEGFGTPNDADPFGSSTDFGFAFPTQTDSPVKANSEVKSSTPIDSSNSSSEFDPFASAPSGFNDSF